MRFLKIVKIMLIWYHLQVDENGIVQNTLCAIDAVSYRSHSPSKQYQDCHYIRDLNKAFVGFSAKIKKSCETPKNQSEGLFPFVYTESDCNKTYDWLRANSEEYQTASEDGFSNAENYRSGKSVIYLKYQGYKAPT